MDPQIARALSLRRWTAGFPAAGRSVSLRRKYPGFFHPVTMLLRRFSYLVVSEAYTTMHILAGGGGS